MPTYEPDPRFLREAVESVLHQTFSRWTLLIHDDASDGDVEAIVRPYLTDARIAFMRSTRRSGIGGNWNACLERATGDVIAFLFQDDAWDPSYLAKCVEILEQRRPEVGLVAVPHRYRSDGTPGAEEFLRRAGFEGIAALRRTEIPAWPTHGRDFLQRWLQRGLHPNVVGEPSFVVLRRSVAEEVGLFREHLPQGLDLEYWTRTLLATDIRVLGEELGTFRVHAAAASMRNDETGAGLTDRLRCIELLTRAAPPDIRRLARKTFVTQLSTMLRRARERRKEGKNMGEGVVRSILPILLKHPILTLGALI